MCDVDTSQSQVNDDARWKWDGEQEVAGRGPDQEDVFRRFQEEPHPAQGDNSTGQVGCCSYIVTCTVRNVAVRVQH